MRDDNDSNDEFRFKLNGASDYRCKYENTISWYADLSNEREWVQRILSKI